MDRTLKSYLSSKQELETEQETIRAREDDKTEALVEAGTGIVLSLWSYLSSVCQRIIADVKTEIEQEEPNQHQRKAGGKEDGKGRGMGTGRGTGRGGGGKGRGRG